MQSNNEYINKMVTALLECINVLSLKHYCSLGSSQQSWVLATHKN